MALKKNLSDVDGGSRGNGRGAAGYKMPTNPELRRNTRQATPIATKQSHPIATKQATPTHTRQAYDAATKQAMPTGDTADRMRNAYSAFRKQTKKR